MINGATVDENELSYAIGAGVELYETADFMNGAEVDWNEFPKKSGAGVDEAKVLAPRTNGDWLE